MSVLIKRLADRLDALEQARHGDQLAAANEEIARLRAESARRTEPVEASGVPSSKPALTNPAVPATTPAPSVTPTMSSTPSTAAANAELAALMQRMMTTVEAREAELASRRARSAQPRLRRCGASWID